MNTIKRPTLEGFHAFQGRNGNLVFNFPYEEGMAWVGYNVTKKTYSECVETLEDRTQGVNAFVTAIFAQINQIPETVNTCSILHDSKTVFKDKESELMLLGKIRVNSEDALSEQSIARGFYNAMEIENCLIGYLKTCEIDTKIQRQLNALFNLKKDCSLTRLTFVVKPLFFNLR